MPWSWRLEKADGTLAEQGGLPDETFTTQADAETWLGENWRELLEGGADQVTLLQDGVAVYGPMSLHPAG
ncbi:hypothetical protein DPM19_21880 [Actinomadura craniellae]|uniref:Uncharacterized protein n=1 Tax=Actinomadura craniellae TaxID=2231787 RepID=A0A365H215_9ACTN|nr:hypothetical protein [Actinomadura craniellae]RAY13144.1 hypothetical protein DPM19_21880 [Actinomadura craniellae]